MTAGRVFFDGRDITDLAPSRSGPGRHGAHLPEPAHLRQHERARERARGLPPARALRHAVRRPRLPQAAGRGEGVARPGHEDASSCSGWRSSPSGRPPACPTGIQRLVEIARALASEPKLLLLDEPAAGMNASERDVSRGPDRPHPRRRHHRAPGRARHRTGHGHLRAVNCLDYGKLIACGTAERSCRRTRRSSRRTSATASRPSCAPPPTSQQRRRSAENLLVVDGLSTGLRHHRGAARRLAGRAQGRDRRRPRRQRRRQDHAAPHHLRPPAPEQRDTSTTRAPTSPSWRRTRSRGAASARCPRAGSSSRRSRVEDNLVMGATGAAPTRPGWPTTSPTSTSCSRCSASAASSWRARFRAASSRCWPSAGR